MNKLRIATIAGLLSLAASPAFAHVGLHADGTASGLLHPFSGLDHVLAMVAVGLFAARLGGRALWAVPASFVGVMMLGGALGYSGLALPYVEPAIALSVIAMGALLAFEIRLKVPAAMALVAPPMATAIVAARRIPDSMADSPFLTMMALKTDQAEAAATVQRGLKVVLDKRTVHGARATTVAELRKLLKPGGKGTIELAMTIEEKGREVAFVIPGRFDISPAQQGAISTVPGVLEVLEI